MIERFTPLLLVAAMLLIVVMALPAQKSPRGRVKGKAKSDPAVSFKKDIKPIFGKYCLPCHTEDQMNPSELYLESYAELMRGGKHGAPVIAGKADSSLIIEKLSPRPPFGDPMPYRAKRPLPEDTLAILKHWIQQGAKDN